LKDELDGAWAVRPLELARERGRIMLVFEDTWSEPLDRLLGVPMEMLRLAIAVAAAFTQLHRPASFTRVQADQYLGQPHTGEVKLTGFGIGSRLPRERQAPVSPESIGGSHADVKEFTARATPFA
jgi:hypothetical protein